MLSDSERCHRKSALICQVDCIKFARWQYQMMTPFARGRVFEHRFEGTAVGAFVCRTRCELPTKTWSSCQVGVTDERQQTASPPRTCVNKRRIMLRGHCCTIQSGLFTSLDINLTWWRSFYNVWIVSTREFLDDGCDATLFRPVSSN